MLIRPLQMLSWKQVVVLVISRLRISDSKAARPRRFGYNSEFFCTNTSQGCNGISFPGFGRIFVSGGTKTLVSQSSCTWPGYVDRSPFTPPKKWIWRPCWYARMHYAGNVHGAPWLPPLSFSYYRLSIAFTRLMCEIRSHLNGRFWSSYVCHRLNVSCLDRWRGTGKFGIQTFKSPTIIGCCSNWLFMHKKSFPLQVFKTLTLVLVLTMLTRPFCPLKWRLLRMRWQNSNS